MNIAIDITKGLTKIMTQFNLNVDADTLKLLFIPAALYLIWKIFQVIKSNHQESQVGSEADFERIMNGLVREKQNVIRKDDSYAQALRPQQEKNPKQNQNSSPSPTSPTLLDTLSTKATLKAYLDQLQAEIKWGGGTKMLEIKKELELCFGLALGANQLKAINLAVENVLAMPVSDPKKFESFGLLEFKNLVLSKSLSLLLLGDPDFSENLTRRYGLHPSATLAALIYFSYGRQKILWKEKDIQLEKSALMTQSSQGRAMNPFWESLNLSSPFKIFWSEFCAAAQQLTAIFPLKNQRVTLESAKEIFKISPHPQAIMKLKREECDHHYRKLVKQYHPDQFSQLKQQGLLDPEMERTIHLNFTKIQEAYQLLKGALPSSSHNQQYKKAS